MNVVSNLYHPLQEYRVLSTESRENQANLEFDDPGDSDVQV